MRCKHLWKNKKKTHIALLLSIFFFLLASAVQQQLPSANKILMDILKKIPKSQRLKRLTWETTKKSRIRLTLRVPFISRMYRMKKAQLIKAKYVNVIFELVIITFPFSFS